MPCALLRRESPLVSQLGPIGLLAAVIFLCAVAALGETVVFFDPLQTATVVSTNMTSTTIRSRGYLFTYSVDGYWSAYPGGPPTGRMQPVQWPTGIDAQTITSGPTGPVTQTAASISIRSADGRPFDLQTFTGKILGNTAGAGASFELMPQLNGNDAFADPLMFDATGYANQSFSHSPNLTGYDTYALSLWMDYGLMQLTVSDASVITQPELLIAGTSSNYVRLSWATNYADFTLVQNSNFVLTSWSVVTNAATAVGTNNQVLVPAADSSRFFRLVY